MARDFRIEEVEGGVAVSGVCAVTGAAYRVLVGRAEWDAWKAGAYIQDAMQSLSADQREFIISRLTPAEFDRMARAWDDTDDE